MESRISLLTDNKQIINILPEELNINVDEEIIHKFIQHFNHWFDIFTFDDLLAEFYGDQSTITDSKKWAHNKSNMKRSINDLIDDIK